MRDTPRRRGLVRSYHESLVVPPGPMPATPSPRARAAILAASILAAPLAGCDFFERARDEAEEALELPPPPVAFSNLIVVDTPLPPDEDGSGPDLYVEVQSASGAPSFRAPSIVEDADSTALPYVLGGGELQGATRAYVVAVLDRDADGYDAIGYTEPFTPDDLRESPSDTFAAANAAGTLQAQFVLAR
jgi:hypothetical protein